MYCLAQDASRSLGVALASAALRVQAQGCVILGFAYEDFFKGLVALSGSVLTALLDLLPGNNTLAGSSRRETEAATLRSREKPA
jgi:hypothetical protein